MFSKAIGFILMCIVAFGMSLLLIPVVGIAFGLLKKLFV